MPLQNDTPSRRGIGAFEVVFGFIAAGISAFLVLGFLVGISRSGAADGTRASHCKNNMKQLALGLWNYHDTYGTFPPTVLADADGRPLHSWRTLILPFLDHKNLYDTIDLTQPWDAPANAAARETDLSWSVFQCPSTRIDEQQTTYLAMVAPGSVMRATDPLSETDITGDMHLSPVIIEVPAEEAVHWMEPVDTDPSVFDRWVATDAAPHNGSIFCAMANGTVQRFGIGTLAEHRDAILDGTYDQ